MAAVRKVIIDAGHGAYHLCSICAVYDTPGSLQDLCDGIF